MKKRLTVAAALALALTGALAFSLTGRAKTGDKPETVRPVRVQKIESGPTREVTTFAGEVRARFETPMAFRVPGRIVRRHVDVGTSVRKGDLVAALDHTDYQLSAQNLSAQVASAEADFNFQIAELARGAELLQKGFISKTDYDRRQNVHAGAKAKLDQARAALTQARNQTDYTSLRALSDGVVTGVDAETGQVVAAGQTVVRIARLEEKEVVISVPENRLDEMRSADAIRVGLWAHPGNSYRGRVREISPGADPVTRTYIVKVSVLDPDRAVQIGMTATVGVDRKAGDGRPLIPLSALVARNDQTFVWVVDPATSTVDLAPVTLGTYHGNSVSIAAGLRNPDYVVTAGVHKLFPHQKVTTLQDEAK